MATAVAARWTRAFTLFELIVTIAVIALLIALVLPGMRLAMGSARGFQCQMSQRTVAFDFAVFADEQLHGNRGDDAGQSDFALETFQESQYQVDEFWGWGDGNRVTLPDAEGNDPMRCPEVRSPLKLQRYTPCSAGAVGPHEAVSFAFNLRLHRAEVIDRRGRPRARAVRLDEAIASISGVPLLFDGDGERARQLGVPPVYSAPALDSQAVFVRDQFWFPGFRHNGAMNVVFLDGHVAATAQPLDEAGWRWGYQPVP